MPQGDCTLIDSQRELLAASQSLRIEATVRDAEFRHLDNAEVRIAIHKPDGNQVDLTAEPSEAKSGVYEATIASGLPGAYRAEVVATAEDGSEIARRDTGWVSETITNEFRRLRPNRELLQRMADQSGGEVIAANRLDHFVRDLSKRRIPITEPIIEPLWHKWTFFLIAISCLVGEWGVRRLRGLP